MSFDPNRLENGQAGNGFVCGLFTGALLGAGFALLFAPKPGADMRRQVADTADKLRHSARQSYDDASRRINDAVEQGRHAVQKGRAAFERTRDDAERYVRSGVEQFQSSVDQPLA